MLVCWTCITNMRHKRHHMKQLLTLMLGWLTPVTMGIFLEIFVNWLNLAVLISELSVGRFTHVGELERSLLGFPHRSEIGFQTGITKKKNYQELFYRYERERERM